MVGVGIYGVKRAYGGGVIGEGLVIGVRMGRGTAGERSMGKRGPDDGGLKMGAGGCGNGKPIAVNGGNGIGFDGARMVMGGLAYVESGRNNPSKRKGRVVMRWKDLPRRSRLVGVSGKEKAIPWNRKP